MFDIDWPDSIFAAVSPPADVAASPAEPARVPLERVEAQICELAGHLAAATCRFLVLLADFDARRGWASWEMGSCAQWLSWRCQMSSGTAREHVRVARAACADLAGDPGEDVSAETPAAPPPVPGDPADPARCHVEDGPAISVSTAQMLGCTAALSWMTHGDGGAVLALGRRAPAPR
jgi:hypothetical protein